MHELDNKITKKVKPKEDDTGFVSRSPDEARFIAKHKITKVPDANGNKDDVFNATNVPVSPRNNHGYTTVQDDKVYESNALNSIVSRVCKRMQLSEASLGQIIKYIRKSK